MRPFTPLTIRRRRERVVILPFFNCQDVVRLLIEILEQRLVVSLAQAGANPHVHSDGSRHAGRESLRRIVTAGAVLREDFVATIGTDARSLFRSMMRRRSRRVRLRLTQRNPGSQCQTTERQCLSTFQDGWMLHGLTLQRVTGRGVIRQSGFCHQIVGTFLTEPHDNWLTIPGPAFDNSRERSR